MRDAILGHQSKDIDIEIHNTTDKARVLTELRTIGHVDERGAFFGILASRIDGQDFDISFPRNPSLSSIDAFTRRDFTINALGYDPGTGELIDPFNGTADLDKKIIRHTSDAFTDDPLRVLRAVQFAGRFGFAVAPETAVLCRKITAFLLSHPNVISVERIWGEWRKLARTGAHWVAAFQALADTGSVDLFPELGALRGVQQDPNWHAEGDVWVHSALAAEQAAHKAEFEHLPAEDREIAVLGALVHDFGKVTQSHTEDDGRITSKGHAFAGAVPATSFLHRIGAPAQVINKIIPIVREHMYHVGIGRPSRSQVRRLLRRLNPTGTGPTIYDWARVVDADCGGRGISSKPSPTAAWLEVATITEVGDTPRKGLLTGHHLVQLGLKPGPAFKAVLAKALEAQDNGDFEDAKGAITWAENHLQR